MGTDANAAEMQGPMSWAKRWRTVQGVLVPHAFHANDAHARSARR